MSFYPASYLTAYAHELLTDAQFRALNPGLDRALRIAEIGDLAAFDPDIGSLTGGDAELAATEIARVERELVHSGLGRQLAITILDGAFPTSPRENIVARARLQALRDAGVTYVFVQLRASGLPLWQLLSQPPWTMRGAPLPVRHRREPDPRRTPRWIR